MPECDTSEDSITTNIGINMTCLPECTVASGCLPTDSLAWVLP